MNVGLRVARPCTGTGLTARGVGDPAEGGKNGPKSGRNWPDFDPLGPPKSGRNWPKNGQIWAVFGGLEMADFRGGTPPWKSRKKCTFLRVFNNSPIRDRKIRKDEQFTHAVFWGSGNFGGFFRISRFREFREISPKFCQISGFPAPLETPRKPPISADFGPISGPPWGQI